VPVRPLDDIRVLDLTHFYNGPYGTLMLSYLGADVVKIEPPGHGEGMRPLYRAPGREISLGFAILNVNKRSVTLNLKSDEGRELFKRMVDRADVVAENFAFGAMESFGLGYEVLRTINPRIIYATGTGYGLSGPYRDLPAFDPVIQAMSGVVSTTGDADGMPTKAGPAVVDMLGGIHLAAAILAALRSRDRTGQGMLVEVALLDAVVPTLTTHIGAYYGMGIKQTRTGNRSPGGVIVPYNVYPASDGYVLILAADNRRWRRLCEVVGRPELADHSRFATLRARATNVDAVDEIISAWTRAHTRDTLMAILNGADVFCGSVKELPEVMNDPHLRMRGMLRAIDDPRLGRITIWTSPLRMNGEAPVPGSPAPELGADTDDFLRTELGLDAASIESLRARKVI
jgi:formyl-CoA transferase